MANILSFWDVSERTNKVGLREDIEEAELREVATAIVPWMTVEAVEEAFDALSA